ncbi:MAG: DUF134 domain-containing protein, partial [Prevotella sp.]|nr:DUF134 domain-containing protein [Prevotella sp.]
MGRNKQLRQVYSTPLAAGFRPYGRCGRKSECVELLFDEYESVRLLDYEGLQQQDAAERMKVSRPTLTRIYMEARRKMATAIVEGRHIVITGGNMDFASYQSNKTNVVIMNQKIAIPTQDGVLCPHFGKAPQVTIVTVEDGKVKEAVVLEAPEHEHGAMPRFIAAQSCTDVLCGGLGGGAVNMLNQLGIQVHAGAPAIPIDELLVQYLGGTITYGDGTCHHDGCGGGHHHHHHHEGGCGGGHHHHHHHEGGCGGGHHHHGED